MRVSSRLIGFVACIFILCPSLFAQDNPNLQNGIVPFGSYDGGDFDSINLFNGNLSLHIPLFNYPQRGTLPGQFQIVGNTKSAFVVQSCNTTTETCTLRWNVQPSLGPGIAQVSDMLGLQTPWRATTANGLHVVSWDGSSHEMWGGQSLDASGIWMNNQFPPTAFMDKNGNGTPSSSGSILEQDTNGNYFNGTTSSYTDTLGRTISSFPGPNGNPTQVQVTSLNLTIQTNFQAQSTDMYGNTLPVQEYGPYSAYVIQSIAIYNGTSWATSPTWTFQYNDRDPGDPSNINYGNVTQITLPTGGTISYTYRTQTMCGTSPLTPVSRGVASRTVNANDGTGPHTTALGGVVTDPLGNDTVHTFTGLGGSCSYYETQTQYYQGSLTTGHLLKTVQTSYTYKNNPTNINNTDGAVTVVGVLPTTITTTLDNGLVTQVVNVWDHTTGSGYTYGNLLEKQEYAYGTGAPGPLLRKTDYTYLAFNNSQYLALNMLDRVASVTVYDGSGNKVSQTTYGYDETSPVASGISTNHLSLPAGTLRGNKTSACRWLNTTGGNLCTYTTYYDTGMPYQVTDPLGNVTTYNYSSTYAGAYVTQTTMPQTGSVQHVTSGTYDFGTGKLTSFTDQNGLTSNYQYDSLWRMTTASFPDGGQTTFSYPNLVTTQRQKNITTSLSRTDVSIFDGLARPIQTQLTSDPQGTILTDTTYDVLGRVATVSNPHRSGTDITTTTGITTYGYDALSRKISETYPDGSILTTAYCGPTTLVTDPTSHWRRSTSDALGRLVEVDEPNAPGATVASTGCPGTGDPIWVTSYTNDTLGNLTQVVQNGSHQRNFTYDSLARLLTSSNPEVGTITYKYDSDTLCTSPNSYPSLLVSKADARGIRTCAQYDALNRETVLNYSNGDPTITTTYDQPACLGLSSCQNIGHRTSLTDAAGSESWSYQTDATNHRSVHVDQRTTNSSPSNITKTSTYYLDLAGNVTQAVYPTGRIVNYTYDAADRPSTAVDGSNGITYATGFTTSPGGTCLTNITCYTPQGTFYALSIGQSTALTNGLNLTHTYNSRLQPQEFKASSSGGNAIDISYSFVDPSTSKNAAHVYGITNNLDTTRSQTFAYDQLNRITSAQSTSTFATSPGHCWQETYGVDSWGNMQSLVANTNSSYTGCTYETGFTKTADGNNHLSGFSYDASGNTTADGYNSYTWDAESQLKVTAGSTYLYDGDGRRVAKANTAVPPVPYKLYWYGAGGEVLAETDASGNTTAEYIFFGGKRVSMSSPGMGVPGTGSATVSGSEQSIAGAPAASGTGSVTFSGTLQSKQVLSHAATSGTGTISISGGPDQSKSVGYVCGPNGQMCWRTVYDSGSISVTVNGFTASASYYQASGTASIATDLANALNASGSPVTASAVGGGVTMTAKTTGTASNYPMSVSVSYDSSDFSHASFTASGPSALTGGANATYTTVYDSGTSTITVNGHADMVSWSGSGTTNSSIASALASSINADSAASVSASASGGIVNLTAKTTGASTNYSLSSSSTYDSTDFTSASFTSSNSGSALTGGHDAGATTYDSGNVWVTINGTQYSVSYGQGSSSSSIASALASAISAGSLANATASGSSVSITSKINGAAANYSLSSGSSTGQGSFSSASFTTTTSGSALTGGSAGIFYYVEDLLGTSRVMTTNAGVVCYDADFYPYGGERTYTNTCPQNYKFEGKERDTETGNDDFGARYYSNRFGRWLSADWSSVPVAVPYANLTNPQTLNLYSMVADDPESFADLDGHCPVAPCEVEPPPAETAAATAEEEAEANLLGDGGAADLNPALALATFVIGLAQLTIDRTTDAYNQNKQEEIKRDAMFSRVHAENIQHAQNAQRGKGNQRETQFEHMTDGEVSRIARDKKDPRRQAAKREEKARGNRRSRQNRDNKKPPAPPKPPASPKPTTPATPPDPTNPQPKLPDPPASGGPV